MPASLVMSTNLTAGKRLGLDRDRPDREPRLWGATGLAVPGLQPQGKSSKIARLRRFA